MVSRSARSETGVRAGMMRRIVVIYLCGALLMQVEAREYTFRRTPRLAGRSFVAIERSPTAGDSLASMLSISLAFRTLIPNTRVTNLLVKRHTGEFSELLIDLKHGLLHVSWRDSRISVEIEGRFNDGSWHNLAISYEDNPTELTFVVDGNRPVGVPLKMGAFSGSPFHNPNVIVQLRTGNKGDFELPFFGCFRLNTWGNAMAINLGNATRIIDQNAERGCTDLCSPTGDSISISISNPNPHSNQNQNPNSNPIADVNLQCSPASQCRDYYDTLPSCDWLADLSSDRILTLNGGDFLKFEIDVERLALPWQSVAFTMEFLPAEDENNDDDRSAGNTPMQLVQFQSTSDKDNEKNAVSVILVQEKLMLRRFVNERRVSQIVLLTLRSFNPRVWHKLSLQFTELSRLVVTVSPKEQEQQFVNGNSITIELPSDRFFDSAKTSLTQVFLGGWKHDEMRLYRGCVRNAYLNEANLLQKMRMEVESGGDPERRGLVGFIRSAEFDGSVLALSSQLTKTKSEGCHVTNRRCGPPAGDQQSLDCENGAICGRTSTESRCSCTKFFEGRSCQFPIFLPTCDAYYRAGQLSAGYRYLQPISDPSRPVSPAVAYCYLHTVQSATSAVTMVTHDAGDGWVRVRSPVLSNDSLSLGSVIRFHYNDATRHFLASLVAASGRCEQEFRYRSLGNGRSEVRMTDAIHVMTAFERDEQLVVKDVPMCDDQCCHGNQTCERVTNFYNSEFMPLTDLAFLPLAAADTELEVQLGSLKCFGTKMAYLNPWSPLPVEQFDRFRGITVYERNHSALQLPALSGNTFSFEFRLDAGGNELSQELVLFEQLPSFKVAIIDKNFTQVRTTLLGETFDVSAGDSLADMRWHRYGLHFGNLEARVQLDSSRPFFARLGYQMQFILQQLRRQHSGLRLVFADAYAAVRDVQYGDPPMLTNFHQLLIASIQPTPTRGIRLGTDLACDTHVCQNGATCREDWLNGRASCQCTDPIGHHGNRCEQSMTTDAVSFDGLDYSTMMVPTGCLDMNLTFYFRTMQRDSSILSVFAGDWKQRYITFELLNGRLHLELPDYSEIHRKWFPRFVADGLWHRVRLVHLQGDQDGLQLQLDEETQTLNLFMFIPSPGPSVTMYLGGLPPYANVAAASRAFFDGCMSATLSFTDDTLPGDTSTIFDLRDVVSRKLPASRPGGMHLNCNSNCDSDAAQQFCNQGDAKSRCIPVDWHTNRTTCDCPNSWLTGRDCATDYGLCFAEDFDVVVSCRKKRCEINDMSFSFKLDGNSTAKENILFVMQDQLINVELVLQLVGNSHKLLFRQRSSVGLKDEKLISMVEPDYFHLIQLSKSVLDSGTSFVIKVGFGEDRQTVTTVTAIQNGPLILEKLFIGQRYVGCINNFLMQSNGKTTNVIQEGLNMINDGVNLRGYRDITIAMSATRKSIALRSATCRIAESIKLNNRMKLNNLTQEWFAKKQRMPPARVFPLYKYVQSVMNAIDLRLIENSSAAFRNKLQNSLVAIEDVMLTREEALLNSTAYHAKIRNQYGIFAAKLVNLSRMMHPLVRASWFELNQAAPDKKSYIFVMDRTLPDPAQIALATQRDQIDWIKLIAAVVFSLGALTVLLVAVLVKVRLSEGKRRAAKVSLAQLNASKSTQKATAQDDRQNPKPKSKSAESVNGSSKNGSARYALCNGDEQVRQIDSASPVPTSVRDNPRPLSHSSPSHSNPNYIRYDDLDSQRNRPASSTHESVVELYDDELNRPIGAVRKVRTIRFDGDEDADAGADGMDAGYSPTHNVSSAANRSPKNNRRRDTNGNGNQGGQGVRPPVVFRKGRSSNFNDSFIMYSIDPDGTASAQQADRNPADSESYQYQHGDEALQLSLLGHSEPRDLDSNIIVMGAGFESPVYSCRTADSRCKPTGAEPVSPNSDVPALRDVASK